MNVDPYTNEPISPAVWERREMRSALAGRDLKKVYELLQRSGISQRSIARRTVQSPSEVYEILRGRQVLAHDVLVRIADGLGVPRGYMGLAYDQSTEAVLDMALASISTDVDEREEVRRALSHAANATMDADIADVAAWWQPVDSQVAQAPGRIGASDVTHLTALTAAMRAVDYEHGGGACRDAVAAQVRWAQQLLLADASDTIRQDLLVALADLHNLAGWTSFDVGMYSVARRHFARALEQAKAASAPSLTANILYRMGRLHLHRGMAREALRFFQLGQIAAQDSGSSVTVAQLCINEAWAYAYLGDTTQMERCITRAVDEFSNATVPAEDGWVRNFGQTGLEAMIGVTLVSHPDASEAHLGRAAEYLDAALTRRGPDVAPRSRIFDLTASAVAHLRLGSHDKGLALGTEAVETARTVRSVRTIDRLEPLRLATAQRPSSGTSDLGHAIKQLRAAR